MKNATRTLLPVLGTLLLLISVAASVQAQTPDFSGTWDTVTDKGKAIVLTLEHTRRGVTGSYLPSHGLTAHYKPADGAVYGMVKVSGSTTNPLTQTAGSIRGRVEGNVLSFTWVQDDAQGAGRFTLSADGQSFEGTFSKTRNPDDTSGGTWNGTRRPSFAGAWQGKLGDTALQLILQQADDRVTGQVNVNSAYLGVIKDGVVTGSTLRFRIVRPGRTLPNGLSLPDEFVGNGELVMDKGGKSFKGTVLGLATSGSFVGR